MRRLAAIAAGAVGLIVLAAGCGEEGNETPAACLEGAGVYLRALPAAPDEVQLADEVRISHCLPDSQEGGELAAVGEAMVRAATRLNAEARRDPGGPENVQLGYLVGAAERGAEESAGVHAELIRRLTAAARYSPAEEELPPAFQPAYRKGFRAGFTTG